ncbi:MAG TPA: YceI family protein [Candidatus Krumholzibacteria bacterium]
MHTSLLSPRVRIAIAIPVAAFAMSCASAPPKDAENPPLPREGAYSIDTPHTFVLWRAQHQVVGRVHGRFDRTTGTVMIDDDLEDCRLDISIDASSLSTQQNARDEDLESADFFDTANYPTIEYHGRGIRRSGDDEFVVDGTLTIRGIKQVVPMTFEFRGTAPPQEGRPSRVAFHGTAAVKRSDFKMTRDLLKEIGMVTDQPDVWIDIDAELLALD